MHFTVIADRILSIITSTSVIGYRLYENGPANVRRLRVQLYTGMEQSGCPQCPWRRNAGAYRLHSATSPQVNSKFICTL